MEQLEIIDRMHPKRHPEQGMDVVIVVASNRQQELFWQHRLQDTRGDSVKPSALAIAVCEEWIGGAGNGLGTLHAYQQACVKAHQLYGIDLDKLLSSGRSVAMYHTAGMGMRLYPLVAAEHNNKAAVRLPYGPGTTTLLEAVIRQTAIYAGGRQGRLSVFWGDQLFIPSENPPAQSVAHVDLLAQIIPFPTQEQWEAKHLSQYGMIGNVRSDEVCLLEKTTYDAFRMVSHRDDCGISLGAFSLSWAMLQGLLSEFQSELKMRQRKCDSDPHFWMPLTLSREQYLVNVKSDGVSAAAVADHYDRMQRFKTRFVAANQGDRPLFQAVDVGAQGYWWDFGTVEAYYHNLRKLTTRTEESQALRAFLNLQVRQQSNHLSSVVCDDQSIICGTTLSEGKVVNSVVVGIIAHTVDLRDCVVIESIAPGIRASDCLLYQAVDADELSAAPQSVRADTFVAEGAQQFKMTTSLGRNGKTDWRLRLGDNPLSYAQLWQINQKTDFVEAQKMAVRARQKIETAFPSFK